MMGDNTRITLSPSVLTLYFRKAIYRKLSKIFYKNHKYKYFLVGYFPLHKT